MFLFSKQIYENDIEKCVETCPSEKLPMMFLKLKFIEHSIKMHATMFSPIFGNSQFYILIPVWTLKVHGIKMVR